MKKIYGADVNLNKSFRLEVNKSELDMLIILNTIKHDVNSIVDIINNY